MTRARPVTFTWLAHKVIVVREGSRKRREAMCVESRSLHLRAMCQAKIYRVNKWACGGCFYFQHLSGDGALKYSRHLIPNDGYLVIRGMNLKVVVPNKSIGMCHVDGRRLRKGVIKRCQAPGRLPCYRETLIGSPPAGQIKYKTSRRGR